MALIPTYSSMFTKDYASAISKSVKMTERNTANEFISVRKRLPYQTTYASESSSNETQLEELESYFNRLQVNSRNRDPEKKEVEPSSRFTTEITDFDTEKELDSLQNYLVKLNAIQSQKNYTSFGGENKMKNFMQFRFRDGKSTNMDVLLSQEEPSDLYLICILSSINIAVFLFEIATPVKSADIELLTLPSLYGAKINELILNGEWWRLVTPMFLHSGVLHVSLGLWMLLTFGPRVCKGYGALTFLLIYVLGGVSGNLTSYIHTPEPTVGGTGPDFGIIGAWFIYQIKNKDVIPKVIAESMFRKAVTATALCFVLSNFGPIDDWNHLGAVWVGIVYGFLTCPTAPEAGDESLSSRGDRLSDIALVKQYADPLKSLALFAMFIIILGGLLLLVEPQVRSTLENSFV